MEVIKEKRAIIYFFMTIYYVVDVIGIRFSLHNGLVSIKYFDVGIGLASITGAILILMFTSIELLKRDKI